MGKLLVFRHAARRPRIVEPRRRAASAPRPCDFCLAQQPAWRYSCQHFAACDVCHQLVKAGRPGLDERTQAIAPVPCDFCTAQRPAARYPRLDFATCDVCHRLIEAGDRKALAKRTYDTAPVPPDLKANPGSRKAVMAVILALHDKFFERAGSPRRVLTLRPIPVTCSDYGCASRRRTVNAATRSLLAPRPERNSSARGPKHARAFAVSHRPWHL